MSTEEAVEEYRALIRRPVERIGIIDPAANRDNRCQLVFDDVFVVTINAVGEGDSHWLHGRSSGVSTGGISQTYRNFFTSALFGKRPWASMSP